MRYCPHCKRFNRGRPPICHFCGRTWHVRLCPRGHANPYNAQYCGTCGSADLTETAGPRSHLFFVIKVGLWAFAAMLAWFVLRGIYDLLQPPRVFGVLSFILLISLLIFSYQFAMSLMPSPIRNGIRKIISLGMRLVGFVIVWGFRKIWEFMR